jgi:topoisomerase-4 subunit A
MSTGSPRKPQQEFIFGEMPAIDNAADSGSPRSGNDNTVQAGHGPLRSMMDRNFLEYASYVICERAFPQLADGLKPVQRRILHALHDKDDGRFIKVANVVGHCMQYHPHGDASIGEALVSLTNRRYLIEGQGNFGNILTGDRAAAPRYIECRLTELARNEVFKDDLTTYVPSYDGRNQEPVSLPCKLPLLLMLGAEGIGVGLSTRILPHNFQELLQAQIAILSEKPFTLYPDFQQGGVIDVSEYEKGNGRLRIRARIETRGNGKLVIKELPYGQTTETLTSSIEDAVRKKKVPVRSIHDFTAEHVEIELVLAAGAKPETAIKKLFAFTACENPVSARAIVIHEKRPVEMDVDEILRANTALLMDLLKRELELRQHDLLEALHAKTLVQIFVENRIYKRIETCKTYDAVRQAVFDGLEPFKDKLRRTVTPEDVDMLLAIRIRRISLFDINRNQKEIEGILDELDSVKKNLRSLKAYVVRYLKRLIKTYAAEYPRRTAIESFENIEVRKLTSSELDIKLDRNNGYLGHAVDGEPILQCSSLDKLVVAWDDGRYKVIQPPDKLFVGSSMLYCAKADRDREITIVYTQEDYGLTYLKRFTFGGAILNREYRCTPEGCSIILLREGVPDTIYLKYKRAKNQRIHQQMFDPRQVTVRGVKSKGNQMTSKGVDRIATEKPRWWKDDQETVRGVVL